MGQLRFDFTAESVRRLAAPKDGKQIDYWDTSKSAPNGFGVRVTANGTKTWQWAGRIYRPDADVWKPTRIALGRIDEVSLATAREEARQRARAAKNVEDATNTARR